ncbi:Uncharacterised protein [uncultured archaeon]|nr:Uncharacterised protein [uncultured archaeon]
MDFIPCLLELSKKSGVKDASSLLEVIAYMDKLPAFKNSGMMQWCMANACPTADEKAAFEGYRQKLKEHREAKDRKQQEEETARKIRKILKPFDKIYDSMREAGIEEYTAARITLVVLLVAAISITLGMMWGIYRAVESISRLARRNEEIKKLRAERGDAFKSSKTINNAQDKIMADALDAFKRQVNLRRCEVKKMVGPETKPDWDYLYSEYDKKLISLFQQYYDLKKCFYYRIKCARSIEEARTLMIKSVEEGNKAFHRMDAYAHTCPSMMTLELMRTICGSISEVSPPQLRLPHVIRKRSKEELDLRAKRNAEMRDKWLTEIRAKVSKSDVRELEKLEKDYVEKYGDLP